MYSKFYRCYSLLTTEGSLLACAGFGEGDKHIAAALAGNIWMSYTRNGELLLNNDPLSMIMIQCMVSSMCVLNVPVQPCQSFSSI